jgi:hypothetical protein
MRCGGLETFRFRQHARDLVLRGHELLTALALVDVAQHPTSRLIGSVRRRYRADTAEEPARASLHGSRNFEALRLSAGEHPPDSLKVGLHHIVVENVAEPVS